MKSLRDTVQKVRNFGSEVVQEMKKSAWPDRKELVSSTAVVIVSVIMLSIFVGISDKVLITLLRLLIPSG